MAWDGQERRATTHIVASSDTLITKDDLKEAIVIAMNTHMSSEEHVFLRSLIKKEERKQELYESLKTKLAGYTLLLVIGFVAVSLWHEIVDVIKSLLGFK